MPVAILAQAILAQGDGFAIIMSQMAG